MNIMYYENILGIFVEQMLFLNLFQFCRIMFQIN